MMANRLQQQVLDRCSEAGGCGLPSGFFRLRYFHGKQMRLADYVDEQRYHAGKMKFHNSRLHGAGILCGLRVSLLDDDGLLLRVGRGAALDDCGREIVVGYDQCVDVDTWYRREYRDRKDQADDPCHPDKDNKVRLCVAIRYAECSQSPEPAPGDPCGSASGGCACGGGGTCGSNACNPCGEGADFGRVSEQFELRLMFHDDARRMTAHQLFPNEDAIDDAVVRSVGGIGLLNALADPIRKRCPVSREEWLLLACFDAEIADSDEAKVAAISGIDYDCATQVLLSTEVIQHLLAGLFADVDPAIGGPEIAGITLQRLNDKSYQFIIRLTAPINASSLDKDDGSITIRRLTKNGWDDPGNDAVTATYSAVSKGKNVIEGPAIYVTVANDEKFLAAGGRYHLYTPRAAHPIVDDQLRRLRPRDLEWRFQLETGDDGALTMEPLT